ncbi:cytochrome c biogenesis protein CcsA [Schlesneria paludicola]|uniref:cytochrome c biogenesis protein CcsA n=1 Tax=Schlesneria paludicola TaxID=360056 RepID=UPI00029B21AD|nr:cytochrome c biogenesis protein CcsA [Schlesneria paludicola]
MLKTSVICFLASYSCAFACELLQLRRRHILLRIGSWLLAAAGLLAQTFYLVNSSRHLGLPPLLSSPHDWLLVLALIVVAVHLFVSLADSDLATGLVVWPIVLALVTAAQFVPLLPGQESNSYRNWKMLHASMLVLGTAGVLQGFVLSLLYLWQYRRLKHRQAAGSGVKLPSLELIERLNRWSILISVPLLTIGIVTGFGLTIAHVGHDFSFTLLDPLVIGGALTWTLLVVLFFWLLTQKKRSPGKQVALLTLWSCGFLIVALVGLEMIVAAMGKRGFHVPTTERVVVPEKT